MGLWSLFLPDATQVEVVTFPMPEMQDGLALGIWIKIQPHLLEDSTGSRQVRRGAGGGRRHFGPASTPTAGSRRTSSARSKTSRASRSSTPPPPARNGQPECAADDVRRWRRDGLFNYDELTALQRDSIGDADRVRLHAAPDIESLCAETGDYKAGRAKCTPRRWTHLLAELPARLLRHRRQRARCARRRARHRRLLAAAAGAPPPPMPPPSAAPRPPPPSRRRSRRRRRRRRGPPSPKPAPPEPPAPPACQVHLEDVPFEACATGSPVLVSYDGDAPAVLPGTLSGKVDLCVAGDTTPIDSTDFTVNLEAATTVVAQLRTATVYATRRSVRVVYQVFERPATPPSAGCAPPRHQEHVRYQGRSLRAAPTATGRTPPRDRRVQARGARFFSSDGDTTYSLPDAQRDELPPFATVSLAKATVGGWAPATTLWSAARRRTGVRRRRDVRHGAARKSRRRRRATRHLPGRRVAGEGDLGSRSAERRAFAPGSPLAVHQPGQPRRRRRRRRRRAPRNEIKNAPTPTRTARASRSGRSPSRQHGSAASRSPSS